jgi:thiol-disulfide isomerase/thioredoxin
MLRASGCFSLALLAAFFCRSANSQCTAPPEIKTITDAYASAGNGTAPQAERRAAQKKVLDEALAAHPTDYFLLDRQRDWFDDNTSAGREAGIAWFAALHEKYPDDPAVSIEYADVLRGKDSAQGVKLLEDSAKAHPDYPWAHFKLLAVYESGKSRNQPRLVEELDAYLKLCPSPTSPYVYRVMMASGTTEEIARHATLLRARLLEQSGTPNQNLWSTLWDMEFKAVLTSEHAAVRERIGKDLARFEALPDPGKPGWLTFLQKGYTTIEDKAAADRLTARLVAGFPKSRETQSAVTEEWREDHPFPRNADHATQQAWYRASAAASHDWYAQWHNVFHLMQEFTAKAELDDTKPDDLLAMAREYVKAYHENPNSFYGASAIEFQVADALIKKKAFPTEIPGWLDEGFYRENNRPSRLTGAARDDLSDEMKALGDRQAAFMRIERARILLDYYEGAGQPAKSRGVEDQIASLNPEDRLKPELFEVRAHAAIMDNRKLDALMFYRAARDLGGKREAAGKTDAAALDKKIDDLYKELGGTGATITLFTGKTKFEPLTSMKWETPKNPLPAFALSDLGGKTWKLTELNGKATLINIWATWCGPCREEHPALQKLYEQVKDSKDLTLLTISVDEEAGLVAPYMTQYKYTFPVLLGGDALVKGVNGHEGFGIPQNWFVTPAGKLETIQSGYGGDPDWQTTILGKLQDLLKGR